jgi:TatD DNase family protein
MTQPAGSAPARLFDAHCHAADARLAHCAAALLAEARGAGVRHCVVNATCEQDWPAVAALAAAHPDQVVASYGVHPWRAHACSPRWRDALEAALTAAPRAALGEAGLHAGGGAEADAATQAAVLREQLSLAARLRRPLSLHCVRAFGPLYDALLAAAPAGGFQAGLLLHSYSGSAEMIPRFAQLGACFSFSATLASMAPARAAALLAAVPDARLLLETDAPDGLPRAGAHGAEALPLQHAPPPTRALAFDAPPGCGCGGDDSCGHERQRAREPPPLNHPARAPRVCSRRAAPAAC